MTAYNLSERFDLEQPHFAQTSTPVSSTTIPDMTSLTTSGRLQNVIECYKTCA